MRLSQKERLDCWQNIRVFSPDEVQEFGDESSILTPFLGSICSPLQVFRMCVAKLIADRKGIATFSLCVERHVSGLGQRIFHTLGAKSPEFVREAQVDVVLKPGLVRPVAVPSCADEPLTKSQSR